MLVVGFEYDTVERADFFFFFFLRDHSEITMASLLVT